MEARLALLAAAQLGVVHVKVRLHRRLDLLDEPLLVLEVDEAVGEGTRRLVAPQVDQLLRLAHPSLVRHEHALDDLLRGRGRDEGPG